MKTMKMPIKSKKVVHTPYDLFKVIREFINSEITGLDDDCQLSSSVTVKDLREVIDSLQFYLAQAREPQILPLDYQVIDDEKFEEEYQNQCQK